MQTDKDRLRVLRNELRFLRQWWLPFSDPMEVSPDL